MDRRRSRPAAGARRVRNAVLRDLTRSRHAGPLKAARCRVRLDPDTVCVIDHHPDNHWECAATWVAPSRAASAQMVAEILREAGWKISPQTATCLLTGLVMDTGGFRFDNTAPGVLLEAARLMEEGAAYARVMKEMFLRKPYGRGLLEARLLQETRFECGGRLAHAVLSPEMLAEFKVTPTETEGVIDTLKGIDGVDIACLLQPESGGVRYSIRSTNPACPVNTIARQLGGGGHPLAAGATSEGVSLEEATRQFVRLASKVLDCAVEGAR